MLSKQLSPREEEILELCIQGMTNESIAHQLHLSIGTVNTYWLRIRLKVGGSARTDTVVRIVQDRADTALRVANLECAHLSELLSKRDQDLKNMQAEVDLLHCAMGRNASFAE
jgi:DNA-binding CsgD family transcriptional regulator